MFGINFFEFCKVFTIVFGTSFMIFSLKKVVVGFDNEEKDSKKEEQDEQATQHYQEGPLPERRP